MSWLSLKNNRFKFKTLGKLLSILKYMEYMLNQFKKVLEKIQHVTGWTWTH